MFASCETVDIFFQFLVVFYLSRLHIWLESTAINGVNRAEELEGHKLELESASAYNRAVEGRKDMGDVSRFHFSWFYGLVQYFVCFMVVLFVFYGFMIWL